MKTILTTIAAAALTMALGPQGCSSSSGYKEGAKTSERVMTVSRTLEDASAQVGKVEASLSKLTSASAGANLQPLFKDYSSNLDRLDAMANDARKRADEMRAKGASYFKEWDAELAQIHNEDIKSRSAQRRTEVEQAFQRVSDKSQTLRDAYRPLMSDLQDIRTALNNDLTTGGVSSIKPVAQRVAGEADSVKKAIAALAAEYESLGARMSPSGK
jgi:hypothetical protein